MLWVPLKNRRMSSNEAQSDTLVTTAQDPVPVRLVVWGLVGSESATCNVAVRVPVAVGVNVTLTVQLAPAAKVVPHVVVLA